MKRTLVVGFGNVYRRDDGLGRAVVNALRERLGRPALALDDDGFDDLGHQVDTILVHQLVPELAETIANYNLIVFVDAHVGPMEEAIREEWLEPCFRAAFVSHQMHPCTVLALAHQMQKRGPAALLLSLQGFDFDFGEGISEQAARAVPQAVEKILALMT